MPARWEFNKSDPSDVQVGVTQRDQFNNDDVDLVEALVRETIQNSTDAAAGTAPVKVTFGLKTLNKNETIQLERNLSTLEPHLEACGINRPVYKNGEIRVLCIEDFNTTGLTGSFEKRDDDNFHNFWRTVGKSGKTGQQGGRWGLGKLVYSSASRIRSFFGLTIRADDDGPCIMGQAVLQHHIIQNQHYPIHGFWFDERSSNGLNLQLPVARQEEIQWFQSLFDIQRMDQSGLSLVIPYLIDGISEETILSAVVNNFYFPILAGRLEVEVGDKAVNATTFLKLTVEARNRLSNIPLQFIKEVSSSKAQNTAFQTVEPIGDVGLRTDCLGPDNIRAMKTVFASGSLVHLRATIALKRRCGTHETGEISLFVQALGEADSPFSLFTRGSIVLPGERRQFAGAGARAALIADAGPASEFLGDAENPAHTGWNSNAEKLTERWHRPQRTLKSIRSALRDFYSMITEQNEGRDEDALIDFFSLANEAEGRKGPRKRVREQKPVIPRRRAAMHIVPEPGGFELVALTEAEQWKYPRKIRLRMAYDMIGAEPFKRFSSYDFDVQKTGTLTFLPYNGRVAAVRPNILVFHVERPGFRLKASGFDTVRDLVVDVRAL